MPSSTQRMSTGIPGCDEILKGGFMPGRSYVLAGSAGCGKTVFSLQWLLEGLRAGERTMYITLSEPGTEIRRNVDGFGWSLDGITLVDLSPSGKDPADFEGEYRVFSPAEVESVPVWRAIYEAVQNSRPHRLVIDSITQLRYLATDEYQFRKNILGLINYLDSAKVTSLLAYEPTEMQKDTSVSLAVDGVIRLQFDISPALAIGMRTLKVEKMRGSDFVSGLHPMRITSKGVAVYPHRIEQTGKLPPGEHIVSSGIANLDDLLGGGLESGTTTLLTGPTGTGKSTLGTQFLAHHALTSRSILFTFEEPASFIQVRSRNIGKPIDHLLALGTLKIVRVNPLEMYPDEFLALIREAVETDGYRMVMVDSLRGYLLAMEEFGKPQAHINNLVNYLSRNGVTTLLINEVEQITGTTLRATDLGVSHLADNIVLLRYAEHGSEVVKVIGCLKKRVGCFQPEMRRISVSADGIQVSGQLKSLQNLLTGIPALAKPQTE